MFSPRLAIALDQSPILGAGDTVAPASLSAGPAACISDSADLLTVDRVAPGQLLTIFSELGVTAPRVDFDGIPADILYSGADQINLRVPVELAGRKSATIAFDTAAGPVTRTVRIVPVAPSTFVVPRSQDLTCGYELPNRMLPVVRNENGMSNSCQDPATLGSTVTLYLNGLGLVAPNVSLQASGGAQVTLLSVSPDPDSPAGVWHVEIRTAPTLPMNYPGIYTILLTLQVNDLSLRDSPLAIFVSPPA